MKKIISSLVLSMFVICSVFAEQTTISWSANTDWTTTSTSISYTQGNFTLTGEKKSGSTAPAVNANQNDARVYAKGTLTIANSAGSMTSILINVSNNGKKRLTEITPSTGNVVIDNTSSPYTVTWTGEAETVVFTVGEKATLGTDGASKAGQLCFDNVVITSKESAVAGVAKPVFTPNGGTFYNSVEVSISCATEGAEVKYYICEKGATELSGEGVVYTAPFTLTENATVFAVSSATINGETSTATTSADFEVKAPISVAQFYDLATGSAVQFANPLTVVYQNGSNLVVKDETGSMLVYGSINKSYKNGDIIPAGVAGTVGSYGGNLQLSPSASSFGEATEGAEVEPTTITAAQGASLPFLSYVKLSNVNFALKSGKNFTITDATGSYAAYNNYNLTIDTPSADKTYDIVGVTSAYNGTAQLNIISVEEYVHVEKVTVSPADGDTISVLNNISVTFDERQYAVLNDTNLDPIAALNAETGDTVATTMYVSSVSSGENYNQNIITFQPAIQENGKYTVVIPAGKIVFLQQNEAMAFDTIGYNSELKYTYVVEKKEVVVTTTPAAGSTVDELYLFYVNFGEGASAMVETSNGVTLTDENGNIVCTATPAANYSDMTLGKVNLSQKIVKAGTYTLNIPAKTFYLDDNATVFNDELHFTYTVSGNLEGTTDNITVDPANNSTVGVLDEVSVTFNDYTSIAIVSAVKAIFTNAAGDTLAQVSGTKSGSAVKYAIPSEITTPGTYKVYIPSGAVTFNSKANCNLPIELTYNVTGEVTYDNVTTTPENGGTVTALSTISITYADHTIAASGLAYGATQLNVYDETGKTVSYCYSSSKVAISEDKKTATFTLSSMIITPGVYTVVLPKGGLLLDENKTKCTKQTFTVNVVEPEPDQITLDPAAGSDLDSLMSCVITYPTHTSLKATSTSGKLTVKDADGNNRAYAYAYKGTADGNTFTFNLNTILKDTAEYVLTLPAGFFTFEDGSISSKQEWTYTVGMPKEEAGMKVISSNPADGSTIAGLMEDELIYVQTNMDQAAKLMLYQVRDLGNDEIVKSYSEMMYNEETARFEATNYFLTKFYEGHTYAVEFIAYATEEDYWYDKPALDTAYVTVKGSALPYVYAEATFVSITPEEGIFLEKAEDAVFTVTFSSAVELSAETTYIIGGRGMTIPFESITSNAEKTAWTLSVGASYFEQGYTSVSFCVVATDSEGRRVQGNMAEEEQSYFFFTYESYIGVPHVMFDIEDGATVTSLSSIKASNATGIGLSWWGEITVEKEDGTVVATANVTEDRAGHEEDYSFVTTTCIISFTEITEAGTYKVVVPAGFFTLTTEAGAYASSRAYTLTITVDPNYTGINGVWAESLNSNAIFDLNGRKVQQIEKGKTYIKNGKAFIVR